VCVSPCLETWFKISDSNTIFETDYFPGTVQGGENFQMEMSQVGFSADYSPQNVCISDKFKPNWSDVIFLDTVTYT
jgi:hypothetical protein